MSTDSMNQFLRFTVPGAYMQAVEQATYSDRSPRSPLISSELRSATGPRQVRAVPFWVRAMARGWALGLGLGVLGFGIVLFSP